MNLLTIAAYTLTVIATYDRLKIRLKIWHPDWQMRAELTAMAVGLVVLALVVVFAAPTFETETWESDAPLVVAGA